MIRVLVAEDMRILRDTLVSVLNLEDDIKMVAQVAAGADIVPAALAERPDLAVLDIDLPGLDRITAATRLHGRLPACRLVILTVLGRPGQLRVAPRRNARTAAPSACTGFGRTLVRIPLSRSRPTRGPDPPAARPGRRPAAAAPTAAREAAPAAGMPGRPGRAATHPPAGHQQRPPAPRHHVGGGATSCGPGAQAAAPVPAQKRLSRASPAGRTARHPTARNRQVRSLTLLDKGNAASRSLVTVRTRDPPFCTPGYRWAASPHTAQIWRSCTPRQACYGGAQRRCRRGRRGEGPPHAPRLAALGSGTASDPAAARPPRTGLPEPQGQQIRLHCCAVKRPAWWGPGPAAVRPLRPSRRSGSP